MSASPRSTLAKKRTKEADTNDIALLTPRRHQPDTLLAEELPDLRTDECVTGRVQMSVAGRRVEEAASDDAATASREHRLPRRAAAHVLDLARGEEASL